MRVHYEGLTMPQKNQNAVAGFDEIQKHLESEMGQNKNVPIPKNLSIKEAVRFMGSHGYPISASSIYKLTATNSFPFKKFGRRLLFDGDELLKWCQDKTFSPNLEKNVIVSLAAIANKKVSHGK